jgi:hypothetical protein
MKRSLYLITAILFSFLLSLGAPILQAQQEDIVDGKEYWVGIPNCKRDQSENVRWGTYPIELWVSSKVKNIVQIQSVDGSLIKTVALAPNKVTVVAIPDILENMESEVVTQKGIHLKAKEPISVAFFVAYKWSGEAFRCTPVEWLGKKYYTLNLYQDYVKMASNYTEYKPGQILVIATEDKTTLKYRPTAETEGNIKAGDLKTVKLNRGETFLILGKVFPNFNHDWKTDLSGTYLEADKPFAVISGHTKGAFPRFNANFLGSLKSDFMRNMYVDAMWPVELLGKEYVSAPIKYLERYYNSGNMIEDFKGDMIRFVATEDNTILYQMRQDGSGFMQISPVLGAGKWYDLPNLETSAYYKANKKVLVGQYGKAWWSYIVGNKEKDGEKIQNPSRNGQGMMFCLTPIEQWTAYSAFKTPAGMDNFVYFTFKTVDFDKLWFDGKKFSAVFGSVYKEIAGSPYSYVTETIGAGDHIVEGRDGGKFAGYAYGNWDYSKDGFAYGYPIGINYSTPCVDSIFIEAKDSCGDVTGTVWVEPKDSSCAIIYNITMIEDSSDNYTFEAENFDPKTAKIAGFTLTVIDKSKPAKALVRASSRSGQLAFYRYEYYPEEIEVTPTYVNFGLLQLNEKKCVDLELKNPGRYPITVTVNDVKLKLQKAEFEIDVTGLPVTLAPGETANVEVCGTALVMDTQPVEDSVIVVMSCYEKPVAKLELRTGEPIVWIGDATWKGIPIGNTEVRTVKIVNESNVPVELYSIDWVDKLHFPSVEGLVFPLKIQENGETSFKVYYKPDVPGVTHTDRANFTSNATKRKLYSDWTGDGIEAGPYISSFNWFKQRVIDDYSVNKLGITKYEGTVTINNFGNTKLNYKDIVIENDFGGVFTIDKSNAPAQLNPNEPVTLKVYFAPKEAGKDSFEDYHTVITFIAEFNKEEKRAEGTLDGSEMQPHISIDGHTYGTLILGTGNQFEDGFGLISSFKASDLTAMDLTLIDNLRIEGPDANAFEIDQNWFANNPYPIYLHPGENLQVPVRFTVKHGGKHTAYLRVNHDAPENPEGELIGYGTTVGVGATDWDFGPLFITKTAPVHSVSFVNLGDTPAEITAPIQMSGTDADKFKILGYRLTSGSVNPPVPFTVVKGDELIVDVEFTPYLVQKYSAYIDYVNSISPARSNVYGEGKDIWTTCDIPDTYVGMPGTILNVDVNIENNDKAKEPIENAGITEFKVEVIFNPNGNTATAWEIYPNVSSPSDIITDGTLSQGWTVVSADIIDESMLVVHMLGSNSLKGPGTLFRFPLTVYLSDKQYVDLPVELLPVGTPWVNVDNYPGKIQIIPICVNNLRLIQISGEQYSLSTPTPNPASDVTMIEFSTAIEATTKLTLYDSYGRVVSELINQRQSAGKYQADINVKELPSGTYYYTLECGPYSETKSLVIVK